MTITIKLTLALMPLALAGCSGSQALSAEGMYEGLKTRERVSNPQPEPASEQLPDYQKYRTERERVVK